MSEHALYHTTAATLASASISMAAAWLLAALAFMAVLIAPVYWSVYTAVFLAVLLLASAYLHLRVHLDTALLRALAAQQLSDAALENALLDLRLRKKPLQHTPQSRCVACLAVWYKSLVIDCVLSLLSVITLVCTTL